MSACISLHCDRTWAEGTCAAVEWTDATTIGEARAFAERRGWAVAAGGDYCPGHSGRRTPLPSVTRLQPNEP